MPGRPDFTTAGSGGSGQKLATVDRPEVEGQDVTTSGTVASGASGSTEIYAPAGAIYEFLSLYLAVQNPGTATSGTHSYEVRPMGMHSALLGRSDNTEWVIYKGYEWSKANSKALPSRSDAQAVRSLRASENSPLVINYRNNLDVDQTNDRFIQFTLSEVSY